jgi:hypothetical protein
MASRDIAEQRRVSTPRAVLRDLCFVVVVPRAAWQLHAALSVSHHQTAIRGYLAAVFGIRRAWGSAVIVFVGGRRRPGTAVAAA